MGPRAKAPHLQLVAEGSQPADLGAADALGVIREILKKPDGMFIIPHGSKRRTQRPVRQTRTQRKVASHLDVRRVLERGSVTEGPYLAVKTGWWRLNVTGRVAGEELTVTVEIEWRTRVLVITILN